MITKLQEKKGLLDEIYYKKNNQRDFYLCGTYIKDGEKKFTRWKTYRNCVANIDVLNLKNNDWKDLEFFKSINQRSVLPQEIVLDVEECEKIKGVIDEIKSWDLDLEYFIFETGSRGFHVHIFFNEDFTIEEKEAIVEKLGTDIQKCSEKTLIALENCAHFKTGCMKREVEI